jgi:hypothetical protein
MNSKYNGSMGYQRLIKEIKRDVGGAPGSDSVTSLTIVNGSITSEDISGGTIDISNLSASAITTLQTTPLQSVGSNEIILYSIKGVNIQAGTIELIHLSAANIASLQTTPANSINSSHIVNRTITGTDIALQTIKGENIEAETITSYNLSISLNNQITALQTAVNDLTLRISQLEQTAVIRSFDTLVDPTSGFSIPVDLAESEFIQIDLNILVAGTSGINAAYVRYNSSAGTNIPWEKYNGQVVFGTPPNIAGVDGGTTGAGANNGKIGVNVRAGECLSVRVELFRSFDINTPSQKYYMRLKSSSFFDSGDGGGLTTFECQGAVFSNIITGLYVSVNGSGTTIKTSYSIIKDKRRAFFNSILS